MRIARDKTRCVRVKVREIAATAAGDKYLSTNPLTVIEKDRLSPTQSALDGTHHAGSARTDDCHVEVFHILQTGRTTFQLT